MVSREADSLCIARLVPALGLFLLLAMSVSCHRERQTLEVSDGDRARAEQLFSEGEALRLMDEEQAGKEAIEKLRASLELRAQTGDFAGAAKASRRIGEIHERTGDLESALQAYQEGVALARKANAIVLESQLLSDVGTARIMLGEPEQAQHDCDGALSLADESGSPRAEADAFICLGELDYFRGNLKEAIRSYSEAWLLWQDLDDLAGQAQAQLFLGYAHSDLSEFDRAAAYYEESLRLWRSLNDRRGEGLTLVALGYLHLRLGEYQSALNSFMEAMPIIEPMGDVVWLASANCGLANLYLQLADTESAKVYWTRALDLYEEAGLRMAEAEVLLSIGEIDLASEDYENAITYFEEALALTRELENRRWEAHSLRLLGLAYEPQGDTTKAIDYYEQSLDILRSGEDERYKAYTLGDLGRVLQDIGEHDRAFEHLLSALDLSRATMDRLGESMGLYNLARTESRQRRTRDARGHIEEALLIAESLRSGVASHHLRSSYLASIQLYYKLHIELLMRLHERHPAAGLDAEAFEASERARARSLLESLTEAGVDVRQGVDPALLSRERRLKRDLDAKAERQFRLTSQAGNEVEAVALAAEIHDLTDKYDLLQAEIRSRSPRYAALTQPQPLSLEAVQREVLDDQTLVLEYSLGEERSFLWAVESENHATFELPPQATIDRASREVHKLLTARLPVPGEAVQTYRQRVKEADARYWESASKLSEVLLGPVADRLRQKRLVVVSDGAMQYLPFSALPVPGRGGDPVPLIVEHEIVNLPSLSALGVLRAETRGREEPPLSVAVLADPVFELDDPRIEGETTPAEPHEEPTLVAATGTLSPPQTVRAVRGDSLFRGAGLGVPRLMATRREADAILAAAPAGTTLQVLGFEASRARAMSPELASYRIIHFATHGIVNNEHPGLSGIVLSMVDAQGQAQDGFLRLDDIYNLELPVNLVVLSACDSALGKPVKGEGLVGMVRGFMYAGARRVVASLWKVDDEATGELMSHFYEEMLQENRSPAAALRQAQIAMWQQKEWQSPFYWAAFVLQGEWR